MQYFLEYSVKLKKQFFTIFTMFATETIVLEFKYWKPSEYLKPLPKYRYECVHEIWCEINISHNLMLYMKNPSNSF